MTHQYTKLADALELKGQSWQELKDREDACREAARILRAADAVDVAGLMALHDASLNAEADYVLSCGQSSSAEAKAARAALESALRLALAAREGAMVEMIDAAMVEMQNIHPPLRRSECARLIRAAFDSSRALKE